MTDKSFWRDGSNLSYDELVLLLEKEMEECDGLCCDFDTIDACLEALDKEAPLSMEFNPYASLSEFKDRISYATGTDIEKHHNTRKATHKLTRYLIASVLILLISGAVCAQALGLDIVKVITAWTEAQFSIMSDSKPQISDRFYDLQMSLVTYDINEVLVPTWLPEGFEFVTHKIHCTKAYRIFLTLYKYDNKSIIIEITQYFNDNSKIYEKNAEDVIEFEIGGHVHNIMKNSRTTFAVWRINNFECSITGDVTVNDLKKMIKSIYER